MPNPKIKIKKLPADVRKWLSEAIDNQYSVSMPYRDDVELLSQFVPGQPTTLYRGLLFKSLVGFVSFLEKNGVTDNHIEFIPNEVEHRVSSWSHSEGTAENFARHSSATSQNAATLNWLLNAKKAIDGNHGILIKATIDPKDILVDVTLVEDDINTKRYAATDEVFVKSGVKVKGEIVKLWNEKGEVSNLNDYIKLKKEKSSKNIILDERIEENYKQSGYNNGLKTKFYGYGNRLDGDKQTKLYINDLFRLTGIEVPKDSSYSKLRPHFMKNKEVIEQKLSLENIEKFVKEDYNFSPWVGYTAEKTGITEEDILNGLNEKHPNWREEGIKKIALNLHKTFGIDSRLYKSILSIMSFKPAKKTKKEVVKILEDNGIKIIDDKIQKSDVEKAKSILG